MKFNSVDTIPSDKLAGPLFGVTSQGGWMGWFDSEAEARAAAAQSFAQQKGERAVMILKLDSIALPAVPKVEFTKAKE